MNNPTGTICHSSDEVLEQVLEEITTRIQAGELVDLDTCVAEHLEYAERLGQLLPAMQILVAFGASQSVTVDRPTARELVPAASGVLGDFRIVRELGRGGMGVVYEADQISIGRPVALKVLPFAAMLDDRRLARFRNEVRAAGQLHHSNIVPVYAVGSDRGVHFYAMQLVAGHSLAEIIAALQKKSVVSSPLSVANTADPPATDHGPRTTDTQPNARLLTLPDFDSREFFRSVAQLAIQAAEALEHAHSCGIVHRDIKPSNLLLDQRGSLWLTDFGLASVESDANLTMTGDLLGTLRYMSPEQALAKRVVVDHRSDIYSLGVTLYELLTLKPIYTGDDRHELLRQIAFEEPCKPRQINARIPQDFETIILKAIEKNPVDRYATAQQVADDLQRFIHDEPIKAKPQSLLATARKWGRRHASLLATAVVAGLVGLAIAAGTLGWAIRDRQARLALTQHEVGLALDEAAQFSEQASWSPALAAVRRAEALVARGSATPDVDRTVTSARRDIDMALRLEGIRLETASSDRVDGGFKFQEADSQYEMAFREYGIDIVALSQQQVAQRIRESAISSELCVVLDTWASNAYGASNKPRGQYLNGIAQAADSDPWRKSMRDIALYSADPASTYEEVRARFLALAKSTNGKPLPAHSACLFARYLGTAVNAVPEARAQLRLAHARDPADFWVCFDLAGIYHEKQPIQLDESIRYFTAAVAIRPSNAVAHNNLGACLIDAGRVDEAIYCYREAIRLQPDLAKAHNNLALALGKMKMFDEAIRHYREAIRLWPESGVPCANLGKLLNQLGAHEEAIACLKEALRREPELAQAHRSMAEVMFSTGRLDAAITCMREALRLDPNSSWSHSTLGVALARKGQWDDAIGSFRESIRLEPGHPEVHYSLAEALRMKGAVDEAIPNYREAIRLDPDYWQAFNRLGYIYFAKADWDEAIKCFRNVVRVQPTDAVAQYKLGDSLIKKEAYDEAIECLAAAIRLKPDMTAAHNALGNAHFRKGELDESIVHYREALRLDPNSAVTSSSLGVALHKKGDLGGAIQWHKRALQLNPKYTYAHYSLACALRDSGDDKGAIESFEKAIRLRPEFRAALENYAWTLVTCSDDSMRNPQRALELAKKAVALDSEGPAGWRTLGAAHYRSGDWNEACTALTKATEPGMEVHTSALLFLAMAQWQLGDQDAARMSYNQAIKRMESGKGAERELPHLRKEAETLMLVKPTPGLNETPTVR